MARTLSSVNCASALGSRVSSVPSTAPTKPSGMLTMPGFSSGKSAPPFMMLGLTTISASDDASPVASPATAPAVLNRRQNSDSTITGKLADAATAKALRDLQPGDEAVLDRNPIDVTLAGLKPDLLRQAVGDAQLNYQGNSYGTFVGDLYANLFPDRVRALVRENNKHLVVDLTGVNAYYTLLAMQLNMAQYEPPKDAKRLERFPK